MHPKNISITSFQYDLPEDRIAFHPLERRDDSKLLVFDQGAMKTDTYKNIAKHLPPKSTMVFNNTKVVEARLLFKKESGGVIEIFCLQPHEKYKDITSAMSEHRQVEWLCLIGGASKWKSGQVLTLSFALDESEQSLKATFIEKRADCFVIGLEWGADISFAEVLHRAGHVPLPPYIKRADQKSDKTRYQTVFALQDGSVAAPTAGLHFTEEVLGSLAEKDIRKSFVTLHVGAGTFKPVKAGLMQDHEMHSEFIEVSRAFIANFIEEDSKVVIAVGTTSLRTLESLYWLGVKLLTDPGVFDDDMPFLSQWESYEVAEPPTRNDALEAILHFLEDKNLNTFIAKTQIIIAPGYDFKMINALITNFHQPASTLLLLVAALVGEDWKRIYEYALKNEFRFLSYGDGSLLWKQ
ncbi:S-adenosylmethionine:tRNA ribosyltransferase-isomerase [Niabella insulamsoli]|uniref:S-adenosylmethionine:tRNA ribosyltransferase-isomerase n=1 Tax=Niabella insulamsoli TaxID=3144874 RepID=UPI0031FD627C